MDKMTASALILRHLGDLDTAAKYLEYNLSPMIWKEIDSTTRQWAKETKWHGIFDWSENDDLWICPPEWSSNSTDSNREYLCRYEFYAGQGDDPSSASEELDYFYLTRLCGAGTGSLGWRWKYGKLALGTTVGRWKRFVTKHIGAIRGTGFLYEEDQGYFFLPVRIDADHLTQAIENEAIEDALKPLRAALDRCREAKPAFDELIGFAKDHFGTAA